MQLVQQAHRFVFLCNALRSGYIYSSGKAFCAGEHLSVTSSDIGVVFTLAREHFSHSRYSCWTFLKHMKYSWTFTRALLSPWQGKFRLIWFTSRERALGALPSCIVRLSRLQGGVTVPIQQPKTCLILTRTTWDSHDDLCHSAVLIAERISARTCHRKKRSKPMLTERFRIVK